MKLNWLKDVIPTEVSYADKPAIDRIFTALKRVEKNVNEKTTPFLEGIKKRLKKLGLFDTKIGRVLSKSNENRLLEAVKNIVKASKIIENVLSTISKKSKEDEMKEKEVKELIEKSMDEKLDAFGKKIEKSFESKLGKLLFGDEKKKEEEKVEEEVEEKDENGKEKEKKEEEKKKASEEKSLEGSLLTKILKVVNDPLKEIKSRFDVIEKELNIKPESDKKKISKKDLEKKTEEGDVTFEGVFQFKDI